MLTDRPRNRELGKLAAWPDNNMSRPEPTGLHMAYLAVSVLRRWVVEWFMLLWLLVAPSLNQPSFPSGSVVMKL